MKLMIQIPCLDEEATLPAVLRGIPDRIDGIDEIEVLVIDDGSSDDTSDVALRCGVGPLLRTRKILASRSRISRSSASAFARLRRIGTNFCWSPSLL